MTTTTAPTTHPATAPTVQLPNGHQTWLQDHLLHRTDGPANIHPVHGPAWYVHGHPTSATTVVTAWLEANHPDTTDADRDALIRAATRWTAGDTLPALHHTTGRQ